MFQVIAKWLRKWLPFRLAIVEGDSMLPTYRNGDWLLFVRKKVHVGDVVLADFAPDGYIVKRVVMIRHLKNPIVSLTGDNTEVTGTYLLFLKDVLGVVLCRIWKGGC